MGGIHEGHSMIPDNSKKKLEQLRQEMALRSQLQQQYDKEMSGKYTRDMPSFQQWLDNRPKGMAKGGSTAISMKDLEAYIRQKRGEFAAKRVQRAADEIPNLENMYTAGALKEAFEKKNAGLMTMNPADFEKYAERMREDITSKNAKRKTRDEKVVSFDDYLKHLAQLQGGFDEVPFLELGHRDAEYLPSIEGHEGRHRSRVLTAKGANKSLVQLLPTQRMVLPMPKSNSEKVIQNLQKTLGENRFVSPEGGGLLPSDQTAGMYKWLKDKNLLETNRPQLPEVYAKGGDVEPTQDDMRLALSKAKRHGMYSPLERLAIDIPRNKGTGAEFMAEISKQKGFKPEEVADRKIPIPEGKMTKLEFLKHLRQHSLPPLQEFEMPNMGTGTEARNDRANDYYGDDYENLSPEQQLDVADWVRKHNAKYTQYQIPGGENYREMLLKLPALDIKDERRINYLQAEKRRTDPAEWAQSEDAKTLDALMEKAKKFDTPYQSGHWRAHPNVLAHVRLSDRESPEGEKLLHVEELQSDWHQRGRKHGYKKSEEELQSEHMRLIQEHEAKIKEESKRLSDEYKDIKQRLRNIADPNSDEGRLLQGQEIMTLRQLTALSEAEEPPKPKDYGVPQAPFKKSWHELGMKHVLHHAAKHGYKGVVITPGWEQAQRWGDEGLMVHYDEKIPKFLDKFGKPHGVKTQMGAYHIKGSPDDYSNAVENMGIAHIPMEQLTPQQKEEISLEADKRLHYFPITEPMRTSILKEGMPQYVRGGVVHKAEGGAVLPIEQMRNELMNKTRFKGLSQLQNIGAEEAPSLGVKAYVPTTGRPDNGQMPVGGIDTQQGELPVGGIDMNKMQQGQQLMPNAPAMPAGTQLGMDQVPMGDKIPTIDSTTNAPTPNFNPGKDGSAQKPPIQSNILSMTPQGQAMKAMQPMARGGKVEVRPTVKDDTATRRTPEIETAIKALQAGIINQKEYDRIVQKYKPVKPYEFVPAPATNEDAMRALKTNQKESWRAHESWPSGHRVGLRLDIPSYENHGVWVNSVHDEQNSGADKFPVSYGPVSSVRNAEFAGTPHKAVRVATGEQNKTPFAKIMGELEHIDEKKAIAHMKKFLNHPEYRQIGYDPRRHGDFYDRATMRPVESAEHVVQIGPLVLAKNPQYAKRRTEYAEGGDVKGEGELKKLSPEQRKEVAKRWAGQLHYDPAAPLSKQDIEKHADRMVAQILGVDNPHGKTKQQLEREKNLVADVRYKKMKNIPNVDYSKLKNAFLVGVPGDPTVGGVIPVNKMKKRFSLQMPTAGASLHSIDNQQLESPVPLYGGSRYGAYGGLNGWASDLGASRGLFNVVQRLHEEDPTRSIYGNTHRMSNESSNHAIHMLDSAISHMRPHMQPQERIDYLNDVIRNVRTSTNDIGDVKPHFVGFEDPNELMLQASMDAKLRKKILGVLATNKHFPGGKQMIDDIYFAISHPELRNMEVGTAGHGVLKFDPTRKLENEISQHPTYAHDIPSELIGQSRYPIPLEIAAPRSRQRSLAKAKEMGLKLAQPFNDMSRSIIREPIDDQYINQLGEYEMAMKKRLGYKSGGKVKLHTDQDTMRMALTKKSKKAK